MNVKQYWLVVTAAKKKMHFATVQFRNVSLVCGTLKTKQQQQQFC